MKMATAARRLLLLVAAVVAITPLASSQHVDKTVSTTDSQSNPPRLSTVALDAVGHAAHTGDVSSNAHQASIYVPMESVRAKRHAEIQLDGLKIREPGEPMYLSGLVQYSRYWLRVSTTRGGELRLLPTIQTFLSPLLKPQQPGATYRAIEMDGSAEYLNVALRSLLYSTPKRRLDDEIVIELDPIAPATGKRLEHRLRVVVAVDPERARAQWNRQPLNDSFVIHVDEDTVIPLGSLSISSPFLESEDQQVLLNVTLAASHGRLQLNASGVSVASELEGEDSDFRVLEASDVVLLLSGSLRSINHHLAWLQYEPFRNYNGPDTIVVSMNPSASPRSSLSASMIPGSDLVRVFLRPVADPIQLEWIDCQSKTLNLTSTDAVQPLPLLRITDEDEEDDTVDAAAAAFFKYQDYLRAEVVMNHQFGFNLRSDALVAQHISNASGAFVHLQFEGRARDLLATLKGVWIIAPRASIKSSTKGPTTAVVTVSKVHVLNGSTYNPTEVRLNVVRERGNARQQPRYLPLAHKQVELLEDHDVDVGHIFNWEEIIWGDADDPDGVLVNITAVHGRLASNGSAVEASVAQRSLVFIAHSLRELRSALSPLQFFPDLNFAGDDTLTITVGEQQATCWLHVVAENDAPTLFLDVNGDDSGALRQEAKLRWFVPPIRVGDPDQDDMLTLEIAVDDPKASLSLPDLSFYPTPGLWIEGITASLIVRGEGFTTTIFRARGSASAINTVFASSVVVEVNPPEPGTRLRVNSSLHVCVSDKARVQICQDQPIRFTELETLVSTPTAISRVLFLQRLPASELISVDASLLPPDTMLTLHLSAIVGSFEAVTEHNRSTPTCGTSVERRLPAGDSVRVVRELSGRIECLSSLLDRVDYQRSSRVVTETIDNLTVDVWHASRLRATQSFRVVLLAPSPRFVVSVSNDSTPWPWQWTNSQRALLRSFVGIAINSTGDRDSTTQDGDYGPLLALNVTCSPSCLLSYSSQRTALVPHVSYIFATTEPSKSQRFVGTQASLTQLLQTLEISAAPGTSSATAQPQGIIEISLAETNHSPYASAISTIQLQFEYELVDAPLRWLARQTEYRAEIGAATGGANIDGVGLSMAFQHALRAIHVAIACENESETDATMVSVDHASYRIIDRLCDPSQMIELQGPLVEINAALKMVQVKSPRPASVKVRFAVVDDEATPNQIDVSVQFEVSAQPTAHSLSRRLTVANTTNNALVVNESSSVPVGHLFTADTDDTTVPFDQHKLFQLVVVVTQGLLVVPLDEICCVHVQSALNTTRLEMEGTLQSLQDALSVVRYEPRASFWGEDRLRLSIEDLFCSNQQSEHNRWSSDILIGVLPVNDAPVVTITQRNRRQLTHQDDEAETIAVYQTELFITIRDVDVENLPATSDGDDQISRDDAVGSTTVRVLLVALDGVSMFVIPNWHEAHQLASEVESIQAARQPDSIRNQLVGTINATSSLTFTATLDVANELLSSVLLISSTNRSGRVSCVAEDDAESALLSIHVSDLGHGVRGWQAQETTEIVSGCDDGDEGDSLGVLKLSLPRDHALLDTLKRTLTVSGLEYSTSLGVSSALNDKEDTVRITGAAAFRVMPEVQRIRLMGPPHIQVLTVTIQVSVAAPSLDLAAVSGTFELRVAGNLPKTTTVYAQAVAMRLNEVMGNEGTGRGLTESMEARLSSLYGDDLLKRRQIQVVKTLASDLRTVSWQIFVSVAPGDAEIASLSIGTTTFVAAGAPIGAVTASATSKTYAGSLGGSFSLQLGEESTDAIPVDAAALDIQNALEALPSIDVVLVSSFEAFVWDVTFFQPGANVPLLRANSTQTTPTAVFSDEAGPVMTAMAASVGITQLQSGLGQGSVYEIDISAAPVSPVYRVQATAATATLGGGRFTLALQDTPTNAVVGTIAEIAVDAVAMTREEGLLRQQGGRVGSSMQSKLHAAILRLPLARWRSNNIQAIVTRSQTAAAPAAFVWTVTFLNAPSDFPSLVASPSTSQPPANAATLAVTLLTPSNSVGGFFTLSVDGHATPLIATTASASEVQDKLNALVSVRHAASSVAQFGRVIVRRREIPAVNGASFAVLFTEQVASTRHRTDNSAVPDVSRPLVTADGGQLTGLGALARVVESSAATAMAALDSTWFFPAFSSLNMEETMSAWANAVKGEFRASHFEFVGSVSSIRPLLRQFHYRLPANWCCGSVSVLVSSERMDSAGHSSSDAVAIRTDDQTLPFTAPRFIQVVLTTTANASIAGQEEDAVVTRGATQSLGLTQVVAPAWSLVLLRISVRVRVSHGSVSLMNRNPSGVSVMSSELWVNGTTAIVNTRLARLLYTSALSSSHSVDVLAVEVLAGADSEQERLTVGEFLILLKEPPLEPQIALSKGLSDGDVVFLTDDDTSQAIPVFSIVDANQGALSAHAASIKLTLRAELGRLSFSSIDELPPPPGQFHELKLQGDMNTLNAALQSLQYASSDLFTHPRDTVTVQVQYHPSDRPMLTDSRSLRIQIQHVVHVPRVVIANGSVVAFASKEDSGYQFPKLSLVDDTTTSGGSGDRHQHQRQTRPRRRQSVVELRRTDLLPPLITTTKPASADNDWRHRWVADFPQLSPFITTANAFAVVGSGSSFFLTGSDLTHGEELWVSDGTTNGTQLFADLMPGDASSSPSDFAMLPTATTKLVFAAHGIDRSWALQSETLCNRERLSSTARDLQYVVAKSTTWVPTAQYDCPQRGWRWATTADASARFHSRVSTGTTTTHRLMNLSEPYVFWDSCDWSGYTFGGSVRKYFRFADSASTGALKHAGRRDSEPLEVSFATTDFAGIVCIQDNSSESQAGRELWIADSASPSSAKRLSDIEVGPRGSNPRFLTPFQSKWLLFQATTSDLGMELYETDGSSSGTTLVEDIWPGPRSANPSDFAEWTSGDGRMYFAATTDSGRELWSTDGLSSVTTERGRRATPTISGLLIGTTLVRDVCAGAASSDPQFLTALGSLGVFFSATDCTNGRELWVTDGSFAGTKMVKDINAASGAGSDPSHLVAFSGKLYFAAAVDAVAKGRELFVSDGTASGTTLLVELAGGVASASPTTLTVANAKLLFHAFDRNAFGSLWTSDGTASGTTLVWDAIFQQSHRMRLSSSAITDSGGRSDRFFVVNNALYYFVTTQSRSSTSDGDRDDDVHEDPLRLEISVSHGTLSLPSVDNASLTAQSFTPSLTVEGSRSYIQDVLRRLLFQPPLNWNVLQTPADHVVQWRFNVSSPTASTSTSSARVTTADLIVRPQLDPPVIIVPADLDHATDSAHDYLSRLRLQCLSVTVLEDVATPLRGFSVRGVDDLDGSFSWELELSVTRGRVDVVDSVGCVRSVLVGQLTAATRVRVVASRLSCLSRLLSTLVYTSDPNASGSDSLSIRVPASSLTVAVSAQNDQVSVPILITEVNDAPYLTSQSSFYYEAKEDQALVLRDLHVVDPDVAATDWVTVDLRVRFGSIAFLYFGMSSRSSSIVVVNNETASASPPKASSRLTLTGTLRDINAALSAVAYTSAKDWNSLAQIANNANDEDGYDLISVELTDGQSFNASTRASLFVYVSPSPDAVVIWPPFVAATSVYAALDDGVLHGDEDAWLETERLGFTTVDDSSRLALDVSVRVSHGQLAFETTALQAVTVSGSAVDGSFWRLRGRVDVVNRTIATLRYFPADHFYGADALEIVATAVDVYAAQQSITTTRVVSIQIHAVNDAPQWTLPSSTMRWTQDAPTRIAGVMLSDVDFESVDCSVVQCELEVVVEATASGLLAFPRLKSLLRMPQFIVSASSTDATQFLVLTGSLVNLNIVLSEIVLTTTDADSLVREPVEIWFTADDKGTFGSGGPLVTRQKLTMLPFQWTNHVVELLTPSDHVLTTDEDTALQFAGTIRLIDSDSSSRSVADSPQYEVTISQTHGTFRLATRTARATTRLLVLPTTSDRSLQFRGFLPQINAALNGSGYVPDADWFGSDEIHVTVREIDSSSSSSEAVSSAVSVFVAPVCDAPQWLRASATTSSQSDAEPTDLELEEDAQALLTTVSIIDVDIVEDGSESIHRDVTVSVEVLDGGGVMFATTRGLRIESEQPPVWTTPYEALRLLFFSRVTLTGRSSDVNAALRGLIYRPQPDFHTNGHVWDAIALTLAAASASCARSPDGADRLVVRTRIHAVNDAPLVVSPRFTRVFLADPTTADAQRLGINTTQEAYEDQELVLDVVALYDVDTLFQGEDTDDMLGDTDMKLRVSCRSCSVRPSLSTDALQRDYGILTTRDDATDATMYFGSISSLNQALLQSLVFKSAPHFHSDALVVLEVSDLGFFGRGDPLTTTFVMVVQVHSVNDGPQILVPPYGTREPPLRVDEQDSVLLRGAPNVVQKPQEQLRPTDHQQLMFADPLGIDSTVRLRSLLDVEMLPDVETGIERVGTSFYASLSSQQLLFSAFRPSEGAELWMSDGSASGTRLLKDIAPGPTGSHPQFLTQFSVDSRVYFAARGPNTDAWRLDPDYRDRCNGMRESAFAVGVVFVVAAHTTWDTSAVYDCPTGYEWMTTADAQRVFVGTIQNDGHSTEPLVYYGQCGWQGYDWGGQQRTHFRFSDSSITGAFKHAGHRDSYRPDVGFHITAFAGVVCRREATGERQSTGDAWASELWATDGTTEGTKQVTRLGSSSLPAFLTEYQGRLFFQATTLAFGSELWASDGSRDGTQLIADLALGPRSSSPEQLTVANGKLFFSATTDAYGRELWLSDGEPRAEFAQVDHGDATTRTGTKLVLDIRPGPDSSTPLFLVALPATGLLLFQADDGVHGRELWASDGSVAGTTLVLDIRPGPQSSTPQFLTHFNGRVFFQADDSVHGAELWTTDGSAVNTKLVVDLMPGSSGARPRYLSVVSLSSIGPALVFAASSDRDPQATEFWISDSVGSSTTRRLFASSREVATLNEQAMLALHTPQVVPLDSGFVYFGVKPREPRRSRDEDWKLASHPAAVVSRSLTLTDDHGDDSDSFYSVVLQCEHGTLSLSHSQACGQPQPDAGLDTPSASLQLRGSLDQLNCLVAEVVYHATPSNASMRQRGDGWDDAIVVTLTEELARSIADGRAYNTTQRIPIHVVALNHAPVVELATRLYAPLGQWTSLLSSVIIIDEDAADDALLFVRLTARSGRVRLVDGDTTKGVVLLTSPIDPQRGVASLEFSASATQATATLSRHVQYACLRGDGCVDSTLDSLTLLVDDNGFSGSGGPQATTKTVTVLLVSG